MREDVSRRGERLPASRDFFTCRRRGGITYRARISSTGSRLTAFWRPLPPVPFDRALSGQLNVCRREKESLPICSSSMPAAKVETHRIGSSLTSHLLPLTAFSTPATECRSVPYGPFSPGVRPGPGCHRRFPRKPRQRLLRGQPAGRVRRTVQRFVTNLDGGSCG